MIVRSEDICFGRPRLEDRRLEVYNIISDLYFPGESLEEYVKEKSIDQDVLVDVIIYCRDLKCKLITKAYEKYCSGCVMSTWHEEPDRKEPDLEKIDEEIYMDRVTGMICLGTKEEIEEELYGKAGWEMAAEAFKKFDF